MSIRPPTVPNLQALLACIAIAATSAAPAQDKVYRCGAEGREYSSTPCPGGKAVDVADPRSADQQREARAVAMREGKLGDALSRERRARERQAARQGAAGIASTRATLEPASSASATKKPKKGKKGKSGKAGISDELIESGRMTPPLKPLDGSAAPGKR